MTLNEQHLTTLHSLVSDVIVSECSVESVLLVEADEDRRETFAKLLRDQAFHVIEARDGAAALHLLRDMKGSLEWLVTNVRLSILSGLHVAFEYRYLYPARPIVFIDDSSTRDDQDLLDGSVTLRSPFSAHELISLMERLRSERSEAVTIGC